MNWTTPAEIIAHLRSLGFGGSLGAGLLGLVYLFFPQAIRGQATLPDVLFVGSLVGAGLHLLVDRVINRALLRPFARFVGYYFSLAQLWALGDLIGPRRKAALLRKLTERYFLAPGEGDASDAEDATGDGTRLPPGSG